MEFTDILQWLCSVLLLIINSETILGKNHNIPAKELESTYIAEGFEFNFRIVFNISCNF